MKLIGSPKRPDGSVSPFFTRNRHSVRSGFLASLLLFATAAPLLAALISYEGATYEPTNSLNGLNGGIGWTNAWTGNNHVLPGGLNYPGLLTASNRFLTEARQSSFRTPATNGFGHLLRTDGRWGRDGTELWISFLIRRENTSIADYAGLSLFNDNAERIFVGTPNQQERWGLVPQVSGAAISLSGRSVAKSETALLVTRLSYGPTNRAELFVNPQPGVTPTMPDARASNQSNLASTFAFNRFRIEGGSAGAASIDEIRFGETYADVTPVVPEFEVSWTASGTVVVTRPFTNHLVLAEAAGGLSNLTISVASDNVTLLPQVNIFISGSGHERTVAFVPATGQLGQTLITATVSNANGQILTRTFTLDVRLGGVRSFETIRNTDLKAFGLGALRDRGGGTLAVTGIVGTVTRALLYWNGPENGLSPSNNALVRFSGNDVVGTNTGLSSDNCWLYDHSHTYRADVTALVSGNGNYLLTNFWKNGPAPIPANVNGVSLLVFHDDGDTSNNRDVMIVDGNDSNHPNAYEPGAWRTQIDGVRYSGGTALLTMHVSDGQPGGTSNDGNLTINNRPFLSGQIFQGTTVPRVTGSVTPTLWDIRTEDISSFMTNGSNNLLLELPWNGQDCVSLVAATVSVPAASAPAEADLMLATTVPSSVCVGLAVVQSFLVTNAGPTAAANVRLGYTLPASATLVTLHVSQGSCSLSNGVVFCQLGNLEASAIVTIELTVLFGSEGTNSAKASLLSDTSDPAPNDNHITSEIVALGPPTLAIERGATGVQFSWPALQAFDPFGLEQATNLTFPIFWAPVEASRQTNLGRFRVVLPIMDARFFRLRKP